MALTTGEANAFNAAARYFLDIPGHAGPVSDERALDGLLLLADKAFKKLMAGLSESEIREAFDRRREAGADSVAYKKGHTAGFSEGADAVTEMTVEARLDELRDAGKGELFMDCEDQTSQLWQDLAAIVEKIAPGIVPFDRREAVSDLVSAIEKAMHKHWGIL